MRKTALAYFLLFMLATTGWATNVNFLLTDTRLGITTTTNRTLWIQRMSVPDGVNNQSITVGDKLIVTTGTNGGVTVTNLQVGLYACSVQAPPSLTSFKILVTATNLGTIYAADCLVADASSTFPAGAVAWAASVTDGRYSRSVVSLTNYLTLADWTSGSNVLRLLTQTLSTNATNYANGHGTSLTNFTLTMGTSITSYVQTVGTSITNYIHTTSNNIALGATNFARGIGTSLTNYVGQISTNATNFVLSVLTNGTTIMVSANPSNVLSWRGVATAYRIVPPNVHMWVHTNTNALDTIWFPVIAP